MIGAADNALSASSLYQEAGGIDVLASPCRGTTALNHNQVKSIRLTLVGELEGF